MKKITFILGGARSGKSRFAASLATGKVAFIATCIAKDKEMKHRIGLHKKSRPETWTTFENPKDISLLLRRIGDRFDIIIIDCLTLLVSNLMFFGLKQDDIEDKINKMLNALRKIKAKSIIVSNEVGMGIVPNNKLARNFRDTAGRVNQIVAKNANKVFFVVTGIPWRIK